MTAARSRLLAVLGLCAFRAQASAQVRVRSVEAPVSAPAFGGLGAAPAPALSVQSPVLAPMLAGLAAPAGAPESAALWSGGIPEAEARRLLRSAHWETTKFFLTKRVRQLGEMIERQKAAAAGKELAVDDLEAMWLDWRVAGYTGRVTTAGFELADRAELRRQALKFFDRHWGEDEASRAAFRRYMDRVDSHVPLSRPSNYRKHAFAAPFDLANLSRDEVPARLDSLLTGEQAVEVARHRAERQEPVLASFKTAALASIRDVNAVLPEGKKVVAVILLGSYSIRQSTPKSDIDYQLLTQDGGKESLKPFAAALERNWTENKLDKVEQFEFTLPPSRELVVESFQEGYQVISPDPAAVKALSKDGFAPVPPTSWSRLRGRLFSGFYRAWAWGYLRLPRRSRQVSLSSRDVPQDLRSVYRELPGGAIRRIADDPVAASLRDAGVRLWAVRHGESESNRAGLLTGRGMDVALTNVGELQASDAARRMYEKLGGDHWVQEVLSRSREPLVILFSPLRRAEQTADALMVLLDEKQKELGNAASRLYEAHAVQDLTEIDYGDLEGSSLDDASKLAWWRGWDSFSGSGRDFRGRFPRGESRFDVLLRQRKVLSWIAKSYRGRTVVAVSHVETMTAQKAILGLLSSDAADQSLRAAPAENARPVELSLD